MKRLNFTVFLMLAVLLTAAPVLSAEEVKTLKPDEEVKAPKMVIDQKNFHFGEVLKGDKILHTFKVKNEGNAALEIRQVKPG